MENKTTYTKPLILVLKAEAGSLLAGSGITGEIPDIPWANSKTNDMGNDLDDNEVAGPRHILSDSFDEDTAY